MSGRSQLFVGRLPIDIRERDVEQVFEKYGRLLRCDVKYGKSLGMYGSSGRRGAGRTGMAYAFVDYDDRRDAEDAVKYENGREIRGHSIVVEWARGPSYRPGGNSNYGRPGRNNSGYQRMSRQANNEECYRCRRQGHWARDCPELERDRYYGKRYRSHSRSRSRSNRYKRSYSRSRSRSKDRRKGYASEYRNKSRSATPPSKERRVKHKSVSHSPSKSLSRSRSRTPVKSKKKSDKIAKKSTERSPSKSMSRSRTPSKSRSRSPEYARKGSVSSQNSPNHDEYDDRRRNSAQGKEDRRSINHSPQKSVSRSRSPSKDKDDSMDGHSDRSPSRSKSR